MTDARDERGTTSPRLGWALAIVATFAAIAGWLREPAPGGGAEAVAGGAGDGDVAGIDAELEALHACSSALQSCRDERSAGDTAAGDTAAGDTAARDTATGDALQCLAAPAVRAEIARAVERECRDCGDPQRAARDAAASARSRTAAAFLRSELAIDDAEQARLSRYLCAARDLRGLLARGGADGGVPRAYEAVRREREIVLGDVERLLGEDRYARLRAIGGVSVLGDATDCDADAAPP